MRGEEIVLDGREPLAILTDCDGWYECPRDPNGKRLGPLVGYAGRDEKERQFVGDAYANFAMAERQGNILRHFAVQLYYKLIEHPAWTTSTGFCGMPEGGRALATALAIRSGREFIFPEKKVTALATPTSREASKLVFARHEPGKGNSWWIVEDVCNNFSTTAKAVALIEEGGAKVAGIACFLNRSLEVDAEYTVRPGLVLPVIALVRQPIAEYKQDDPRVAADIQAGNVVLKPKNEWPRLKEAMAVRSRK